MAQKKQNNFFKPQGYSFNNPQNKLLIRQFSCLQSQLSQKRQYNPQKLSKELFQFKLKEKNKPQNFLYKIYQNYKISLQYHDQMINCIIEDQKNKQYQTLITSSMTEFEIFKNNSYKVKQLYDQIKEIQHTQKDNFTDILVTQNKDLKIKITRIYQNRKKLSIEGEFKTWKITYNGINQIQKKIEKVDRKVNQSLYGKEQIQLLWQNYKQIKDKVILINLQTPQDQQFMIKQNKLIVQIGYLNKNKNYSLSLIIRNKDYEQFQTIITDEMSQFQELKKRLCDVSELYNAMKMYVKSEINDSMSYQDSLILQIDNKYNINITWKEKRSIKDELFTYKGHFQTFKISQTRIDILEKKVKNLENQNQLLKRKTLQEYFDKSHPHFSKFLLMNNNRIIANFPDRAWYQITSPKKISETFTNFQYKVIKTSNNYIMYGIGSNALKNNQVNQQITNNDFIGYNGDYNGQVYDQKNRSGFYLNINGGTITRNDTIRVNVNLKAREVSWYKNGNTKLYTSHISQKLAKKDLYPVLIMYHNGDTVQMNYQ